MSLSALIDTLLEITVLGSFSRVGSAIRRRLFSWTDPVPGALAGRTVILTGPTSGLGRETADRLAELGARIVLVGRDPARLETVRAALTDRHGEDRFPTVAADLSSLDQVNAAVDRILLSETRIDLLIDNAGAITPERTTTEDGLEKTFATMVAGPFALIAGLLPLLRATPDARVVAVTSGGQYAQSLHLDDVQYLAEPFDGVRAYARAKRAQVSLVREWARRLTGARIRFVSMHPGWADTPGLEASLPGFRRWMRPLLRSPRDGVDTIVWLATARAEALAPGRLYLDRRPRPFDRAPRYAGVARRSDPPVGRRRVADRRARPRAGGGPMTRLQETVVTALPVEVAFPFIADFANNPVWDPGTASARRIGDGPVGVGSTYELDIRIGGRTMSMTYRITAYEPNRRVELDGVGATVRARDDIRFTRTPTGGTHVDYVADIRLTGWMRLLTPLAGGALRRIGEQARDGMQRELDERVEVPA